MFHKNKTAILINEEAEQLQVSNELFVEQFVDCYLLNLF